MKEQSLHQIMNEMAGRLDLVHPDSKQKPAPQILSELDAFIQVDDLLQSLHKDYLEAKAQRRELQALYGDDDAMAEVAMDMEDSSWCAMQTRYLELRLDRELMAKIQQLMRRVEEEVENEKAREKAYQAQQFSYYLQGLERIRKMNEKSSGIFEWMVYLMVLKFPPQSNKPNYLKQQMAF